LADTASEWESERLAVFGQTLDENVVGKVHGKVVGLWRCDARSVFGILDSNSP
jgi:protocatechuate 3,4-dioxygenase beta subunit